MKRTICTIAAALCLAVSAEAQEIPENVYICGKTYITVHFGYTTFPKTETSKELTVANIRTIPKRSILYVERWIPGKSAYMVVKQDGEMKAINLPSPNAHLLWRKIVECLD